MKKRITSFVAAAFGAALLVPVTATAAEAVACPSSEFCLYYNSGLGGSHFVAPGDVPDLAGYRFTSSGAGQGQAVKNNAASAHNKTHCNATVYFNSNYGGPSDTFGYMNSGNLVNTYNENASVRFATFCG
ncbi:peptidase inhibitor family I36 protein [Streptomyces jumonjinensis]|uniref:Peptidase M23 n=1 Tax=Streptomyces jumonjinensis TaxID=1945 RepID=A0A646KJX2_STRJU|nr:peptidase inhibitor family I36 protein [Streptomyces jumonjinensis]MQT02370.1 peptidase M23 [Streptomyces jumonjinensis]